jgi:N-acetylneuraminic acid mutarotase
VLGTQTSAILSIVDNDLNSGFTGLTWATEVGATESTSESLRAVVDGKFYVFGGFNTDDFVSSTSQRVSVYEPATNTWKRLGDMPTKLTHSPSVVDGHNVYFIGGYDGLHPKNYGTAVVWKYDTLQDDWTTFVPLPVPKGAGTAVLLGREIHFFGGMNQSRTINSGDHFVLNLDDSNPTWRTAAPLPNPRNHLGGVALNGKVYAVGGQLFEEDRAIVQTQVDVYDPMTNQWTQVASLPKPRSQMGEATFVMDGRIIVAGGEDSVNNALADVTAYDPVTNQWTALTPLPSPRRSGVGAVIGSEFIYSTGWNIATGQNNTTWSGLPLSPPVSSPGTFGFSSPTYTVNENGTPVNAVTVTRTGGANGAVSVTLTPSNGTAIAPNDYNNSPIVVNFANGETSKTVTIPIVNDGLVENTETLNLSLSNATGGATIGVQNTAVFSILDNDGPAQVQINMGGGQYTDTTGQLWLADQYFTGSTNTYAVTNAIAGTNNAPLYQNERYGKNFGYNIPVTNGTYIIDLNFAELYWNAAAKRIFNVALEGQTILQNFDIWSQAGGQYKALTKSFQVTVTDGVLNVNFSTSVDNAQITSLRLLPASSPSSSSGVLALSDPLVLPVA